jgi:hypothetical protein
VLHRGRLHHVHQRTLCRAIGEPDKRNREPLTYAAAVERLMLLHAVIWPAVSNTLADKVDHGEAVLRCERVTGSYMHLHELVGTA